MPGLWSHTFVECDTLPAIQLGPEGVSSGWRMLTVGRPSDDVRVSFSGTTDQLQTFVTFLAAAVGLEVVGAEIPLVTE